MSIETKPLITVVTVTLNCKHLIEETIQSVVAQDYPRVEYIVVDGKSTDGTLSLIKKYPMVTKLVSEHDLGIYDAMNKGIDLASSDSEYITFLNAGDTFHDESVVSNLISFRTEEKNHLYGDVVRAGELLESPEKVSSFVLATDMLCHQAIFFSTPLHKKFLYNVRYKICADYDLLLSMIESDQKFKKVDVIIATLNDCGISSTFRKELHAEKKMIRKKHLKAFVFHLLKRRVARLKQHIFMP